jgi:hypothetical protein
MTDRIHSLTVTLPYDVRADDAVELMAAIRQLRLVVDVSASVADITSHMAEVRARDALSTKIWDVMYPPKDGK